MFTIRQTDEGWEIVDAAGSRVGDVLSTYRAAIDHLAVIVPEHLATIADDPDVDGLLSERWTAVEGIAFSEETGDGRDFTNVAWSWRDPESSTLPLMLHTETEMGHFGAQLAGYIDTIGLDGATPVASGRFYDSEIGRAARDLLLSRQFGVSVDPGPGTEVEGECLDYDEDEFGPYCVEWVDRFLSYEIIGLTMTPFPGFARAAIQLDVAAPAAETADEDAVAASAVSVPTRPPVEWFRRGDVDSIDWALTISDDGQVSGLLAATGTCHVGYADRCVTPPSSSLAYSHFHTGEVVCADGTRVPTGPLTWGIPHADLSASLLEAQAHYADSRHGFADVAVGENEHGIWVAGALRPGVTEEDVRILRSLALSGDWRYSPQARNLELIAGLAVNAPGFPIARVASARGVVEVATRARSRGEDTVALVASGVLPQSRPVTDRARLGRDCGCGDDTDRLAKIESTLARIDRRTSHLNGPSSDALLARIRPE